MPPCPHVPKSNPKYGSVLMVKSHVHRFFSETLWSRRLRRKAWWSWKTARRCQQPRNGDRIQKYDDFDGWFMLVYGWFIGWFMAEYDILWIIMIWDVMVRLADSKCFFFQNCNPTWQPSLARWNAGWIQTTVQFVLRRIGISTFFRCQNPWAMGYLEELLSINPRLPAIFGWKPVVAAALALQC